MNPPTQHPVTPQTHLIPVEYAAILQPLLFTATILEIFLPIHTLAAFADTIALFPTATTLATFLPFDMLVAFAGLNMAIATMILSATVIMSVLLVEILIKEEFAAMAELSPTVTTSTPVGILLPLVVLP